MILSKVIMHEMNLYKQNGVVTEVYGIMESVPSL